MSVDMDKCPITIITEAGKADCLVDLLNKLCRCGRHSQADHGSLAPVRVVGLDPEWIKEQNTRGAEGSAMPASAC